MLRKNLMVDEALLKEAKRLLNTETESSAVNLALQEVIRLIKIKEMANHFGSGAWEGSLDDMRTDRSHSKKTKKRA